MTISIQDFHAVGDGKTLDTPALQAAIDAAHAQGGGTVLVPGGKRYLIGSIFLKSHVTLHLENGSTLLGSTDPAHYTETTIAGEYGGNAGGFLIQANNADHVAIIGQGVIDGQGQAFMDGYREGAEPFIKMPRDWRPRLLGFLQCKNLTIRDITLRDAAQWTCHLTGCEDVLIDGVRIQNDWAIPNNDGINPDHCRRVRISNCTITAGDDGIVLKTTKDFKHLGPTEDVTITNCIITSTSAGIKIGTESHNDFRNITVTGCILRDCNRGLAIQLRDGGHVSNVLFSSCIVTTRLFHEKWWGKAEPIYVTALPRNDQTTVGQIDGVVFSDILCESEAGIFVCGTEDQPIRGLALRNIRLQIQHRSRWPIGWHDRRPIGGGEHTGLSKAPLYAMWFENAEQVDTSDLAVNFGEGITEENFGGIMSGQNATFLEDEQD